MNRSQGLGTVWSHGPQPVPAGQRACPQTVPSLKRWDHCRPPDEVGGGAGTGDKSHTTINHKRSCKSKPDMS